MGKIRGKTTPKKQYSAYPQLLLIYPTTTLSQIRLIYNKKQTSAHSHHT
jgi:hypothetical protein